MNARHLFVVLVVVVALGCRREAAPPPVNVAPPPTTLVPDEAILRTLDYYEPMYKVDDDGRVTHMRMNWRHLPNPVLADVGKLTEIIGLDLYGASFTDDGLGELTNLQKLRSFGLGGTPITDKGLVHLEKLKGLQFVWLPKNRISEEAADKLRNARPDLNVYLQ